MPQVHDLDMGRIGKTYPRYTACELRNAAAAYERFYPPVFRIDEWLASALRHKVASSAIGLACALSLISLLFAL